MSRAIRRGVPDEQGPPELSRMLRAVELDYRANVQGELRRRRHFMPRRDLLRLKTRRSLRRAQRAVVRAAA